MVTSASALVVLHEFQNMPGLTFENVCLQPEINYMAIIDTLTRDVVADSNLIAGRMCSLACVL